MNRAQRVAAPARRTPGRDGTSIAIRLQGNRGYIGVSTKPRLQKIIRERRQYNQWVASQTLEDYALRFTAQSARKSTSRVGNTALGPIAFLACEAIGGTITLLYGFENTAWAIGVFALIMFLIGLPIAFYAAKYGVDIDLLTRGAGFGYMGSTVTSLIYASFTFLLFAIEASIMSVALNLVFGIPMWLAHILSSLVVIPFALYGISLISKMQIVTQPIWLVLQFVPLAYIAWANPTDIQGWTHYSGKEGNADVFRILIEDGEVVRKVNLTKTEKWDSGPGWGVHTPHAPPRSREQLPESDPPHDVAPLRRERR